MADGYRRMELWRSTAAKPSYDMRAGCAISEAYS